MRLVNAQAAQFAIDKAIAPPEAFARERTRPPAAWAIRVSIPTRPRRSLARRRELDKLPPKDNAELGTVAPRAGGGQMEVIERVVSGRISRESGAQVLIQTFRMSAEQAELMLGPRDWKPEATALPPAPPGPPPDPAKGTGAGAPQGMPGPNAGGDPKTTKDEETR